MDVETRSRSVLFSAAVEGGLLTLIASVAVAATVLTRGSFGWSWDALNHHIYLGMIAEAPRWSKDVAAAASQSYQYPYLYWPTYRLSLLSGAGAELGAVWAAAQTSLVIPPVWLLIRRTFSTSFKGAEAIIFRTSAVALSLASLPVLAVLVTTANDVLATVPVLWALAIGLPSPRLRTSVVAGVCLGVAVAFKFSNALFLPSILIFAVASPNPNRFVLTLVWSFAGALSGFLTAYAPWGVQLWRETGNPFYPNLTAIFG